MTKTAGTDSDEGNLATVVLKTESPDGMMQPVSPSTEVAVVGGRFGLGAKFFLATAALLTLTLGTVFAVTSWQTNTIAEATIREALGNVPTMFRAYRSDLEGQLRGRLSSLAELAGTKALFAPDVSAATRYDFAREQAGLLKAKTLFMFDADGLAIGRSDKGDGEGAGVSFRNVKWVADPLWNRRDASAAIVEKGEISLVASVALMSGEGEQGTIDGAIAAAFPLGQAEVDALRGITRGEVAFVTNTAKKGELAAIAVTAASTAFDREGLAAALTAGDGGLVDRLLNRGETIGPLDLTLGGETRLVMALPITSATGEALGAFVVARSRSEETAAFRKIVSALLWVGLAALALSFPLTFLMGRGVARPLEQLTRGALAIRDGQLDVKLPAERSDEVGALARAFHGMVGELREKRALQDLLEEMGRRETQIVPVQPVASEPGGIEIGKRFGGRYEIVSMLGKGGMGQVYQANDLELDDVVAIKVLSPEAFRDGDKAVAVLKREIRLARKITHQNVVRVHDFAEAGNIRFVTMEYVPGTTLRALVARRGALDLGPGLQIAKQLCRGLGAIHQAGILHRDMKPENAMVLPNGMLKLMDFGIAEVIADLEKAKKSGFISGTPSYMSPEQLRDETLDARADIFALGVILYEMFSGIQPFRSNTLAEVVQKIVNQPAPRLADARHDLPEQLTRLIAHCMEKKREDRPESAAHIYRELVAL